MEMATSMGVQTMMAAIDLYIYVDHVVFVEC